MRRACRLTLPEKSYFAKSSFLNRERSKTIQPQEREKDGMQASRTAFTGGMAEKQMGPKKITKVATSMTSSVIFSSAHFSFLN